MARLGLNQNEIAKAQGVNPSTIWRFLSKLKLNKSSVDTFRANRADIFAELQGDAIDLQKRVIASFDDGILSALKPSEKTGLMMSLNAVTGTIYDKERLETGKSTQNVSSLTRILGSAFDGAHKPLIDKGSDV